MLLVAAVDWCCWLLLLVAAVDCCCWLLLLVAAVDCCCWLLLLIVAVDCCWWLLLLIAAVDCCCWLLLLVAAQKLFEYFRNIFDDLRLRQFAGEEVFEYFRVVDDLRLRQFAGEEVSEYFRVVDDLRLRQFCRRKNLWIFSGCWWKVFEYFRVVGEKSLNISRILMGEKWKRGSPRGSRPESEWILGLCAGYLYSIIQDGRRLSESQ